MFNTQLKKKIQTLERRIADLEHPFEFEVGQKVNYTYFDGRNDVALKNYTIVDREIKFEHGLRWNHYTIFKGVESRRGINEWALTKA